MRKVALTFTALSVLVLGGCTSNNVILIAPNPALNPQTASKKASLGCTLNETQRKKYETGIPPKVAYPKGPFEHAKLYDEHKDGCASIEFQLDEQGNVIKPKILKESPAGYDLGKMLLKQTLETKFAPPQSKGKWYFMNSVIVTSAY